ncbi:MAG: hypothetical protein E7342_02075 [Clostridiales bacterium]|nr:hypothetical protein [Clostridiales bacterium]
MFIFTITSAEEVLTLQMTKGQIWSFIIATALIFLALHFLCGFGLKRLAEKQKISAKLAFVPFARYILIGKLIGKTNFFGKKINNFGKIVMGVAIFALVTALISDMFNLFHIIYDVSLDRTVYYDMNLIEGVAYIKGYTYSTVTRTYKIFAFVANWVAYIGGICYIVATWLWTYKLFRKYSMRNHMLFAFFSIILCFATLGSEVGFLFTMALNTAPIFVFIVRNNDPIDIDELMKKQFRSYYGMPSGFNPFNDSGENSQTKKQQTNPFDDFEKEQFKKQPKEDDSPFDEFK